MTSAPSVFVKHFLANYIRVHTWVCIHISCACVHGLALATTTTIILIITKSTLIATVRETVEKCKLKFALS